MTTDETVLIGMFENLDRLDIALEALEKAGFDQRSVSIITSSQNKQLQQIEPDGNLSRQTARAMQEVSSEKTMGASTLAGGALGGALGAATLMGPLLVAGPILGLTAGAVAGSLLSAVESWGVGRDVAERYQASVEAGHPLVLIRDSGPRLGEAERVLATCGPESLRKFQPTR